MFDVCILMLAWASFSLLVSDIPFCLFLEGRHTAEYWGSVQWAAGKSQVNTRDAKISQGALRGTKEARRSTGASWDRQGGPSEG